MGHESAAIVDAPDSVNGRPVFTEAELPRGKMMLVGRRWDGKELGMMLDPVHPEIVVQSVEALHRALKYAGNVFFVNTLVTVDREKVESILLTESGADPTKVPS